MAIADFAEELYNFAIGGMILYKKIIKIVLPLVLSVSLLAGCGGNVVATVNGVNITAEQVDEQMNGLKKQYAQMGLDLESKEASSMLELIKSQVVDNLINQELMLQDAKKQGFKIDKAEIDKQMKEFKDGFQDDAEYKAALASQGYTEPKLRDLLEKNDLIVKLQEKVTADVKPATEEQAREYYQSNVDKYTTAAQYEVKHILFSTQNKTGSQVEVEANAMTAAESVLNQLAQGGDFATLAKEKSEDPGTAVEGGAYVFAENDQNVDNDFKKAAMALTPGQYTLEPVKTQFGYHIIKLEKITPSTITPFEQVQPQIMDDLENQKKQEVFADYVKELREKADVHNTLESKEKTSDSSQNKDEKKTE